MRSYSYKAKTYTVTLRLEEKPPQRITTTLHALTILNGIFRRLDADREHFVVLALDAYKQLLGYKVFATGEYGLVRANARAVFAPAFHFGAHGIVLAHNHPSGRATATAADRKLENRLRKLGESLQITLHDHIIITAPFGTASRRRPWTTEEVEVLIALAGRGLRANDLARQLGRQQDEIVAKAAELVIRLPSQKRYS